MKRKIVVICVVFCVLIAMCFSSCESEFGGNITVIPSRNYNAGMVTEGIIVYDNFGGLTDAMPFSYELPVNKQGEHYANHEHSGSFIINAINEKYVITTVKTDGIHRNRLKNHEIDQLVFLNSENATAEPIFECYKTDRIIYGNSEFVVVFSGADNSIKYISIPDNKLIHEEQLNLNLRKKHSIEVLEEENAIEITRISAVRPNEVVATLSLI